MKKIITALFFVISALFFTSVNAQQKPAKKATAKTSTVKAKDATMTQTAPLKKDGTADMRYKENKMKAQPVGPKKKDGTADMRYKANKEKAKSK
jgi:outer membrane lipoprotein-sorting protein